MEQHQAIPKGRTILIVDDEPLLREVLKRVLARQDHLVLVASNGREALELCVDTRPDLILMDINMPDMDGYEVTARLKQFPSLSEIPVIFLTGRALAEDAGRSSAVGGAVYLSKPFNENQIRDVVNLVLASAAKGGSGANCRLR